MTYALQGIAPNQKVSRSLITHKLEVTVMTDKHVNLILEQEDEKASAQAFEELHVIHQMLQQALQYNLQAEVVWSFTKFIQDGRSLFDACYMALSEWDI